MVRNIDSHVRGEWTVACARPGAGPEAASVSHAPCLENTIQVSDNHLESNQLIMSNLKGNKRMLILLFLTLVIFETNYLGVLMVFTIK